MTRPILVTLIAAGLALAACEANVEDHCISGPCGPDAQPVFNAASGTGGSGAGDGGPACAADAFPDTGDLPCVVWEVMHARCHCCHQDPPAGGAPFPLLTYENTHEQFGITKKKKWQRMSEVIQPDGLPHMPYTGAKQLSDEEKQTLDDWFAACAPPADQYQDGGMGCDGKLPPPPANPDHTSNCEPE